MRVQYHQSDPLQHPMPPLCKNCGKARVLISQNVSPSLPIYIDYTSDIYHEARNHPAADLELPPTCLLIYDRDTAPGRFNNRDFVETPIGRACREWNSRNGISYAVWCLIVSSASMCGSCLRMFSIDGHAAHMVNGACSYCSGSLATSACVVRGMSKSFMLMVTNIH